MSFISDIYFNLLCNTNFIILFQFPYGKPQSGNFNCVFIKFVIIKYKIPLYSGFSSTNSYDYVAMPLIKIEFH